MDRIDYLLKVAEIEDRRNLAIELIASSDQHVDVSVKRIAAMAVRFSPAEEQLLGYPTQEQIDLAIQEVQAGR
jgi:hypothetical protein